MRLLPDQRGYTLQEVMVVIFVTGILGVLVVSIFISGNQFFQITRHDVDIQSEMSRVLNLLQRDIRGAESVSEYPLGSPTYVSDSDTLVVRTPSLDANGDIITATYDYFIYSLSGGGPYTLTREVLASGAGRSSGTATLSANVISLTFTYNETPPTQASELTGEVMLEKTYQSLPRQLTSRVTAQLRN